MDRADHGGASLGCRRWARSEKRPARPIAILGHNGLGRHEREGNIVAESAASRAAGTPWPGGINVITLFVEQLDSAKRFYRDVFGVPLTYEDDDSAVFDFGNTSINLLLVTEAPDLIAPASVAPPEAGARLQFTIQVDDVDAMCAALVDRGVELLNGPMDRPWGIRTASFRDPSGQIWEIAK